MQYLPDIKINESLVEEMTEEEKEEWCKSDPSRTFKYNQLTRRVRILDRCDAHYSCAIIFQQVSLQLYDAFELGIVPTITVVNHTP